MSKVCIRIHSAIAGMVLACGLAASLSAVLLFSVVDGLTDVDTWFWAGISLGPFVLAAVGIWLARGSIRASCIACLLAVLIIRVGGEFTYDCIRILNLLHSGGELKETWYESFNLVWRLVFIFYCYFPAAFALAVICVLADLTRRAAICNGKDTNDSPKVD